MCGGPKRRVPSASAAPMPRPAPVTAAAAKDAAAGVNKGTYRKAVFRKEHRLFAASGWVDKLGFIELLEVPHKIFMSLRASAHQNQCAIAPGNR